MPYVVCQRCVTRSYATPGATTVEGCPVCDAPLVARRRAAAPEGFAVSPVLHAPAPAMARPSPH